MLFKCSAADNKLIEEYIGSDYSKCLYLYMDFKQYGVESDKISVYIQYRLQKVSAIILIYYSCIHLYSKENDFNTDEIIDLLKQGKYSMIYCPKDTAIRIWNAIPDKSKLTLTCGWVAQIKQVDQSDAGHSISATSEDFNQIVRMIYEDEDIGRSYNFDDLAQQLRERSIEGYTRNLVIKDKKTVVAHACTNAELGNIAVVAELVVNKAYRRQGYATEIWRCLCRELLHEGKEVYSFYYSEESRMLHKKIGFFEVCEWGKIVM